MREASIHRFFCHAGAGIRIHPFSSIETRAGRAGQGQVSLRQMAAYFRFADSVLFAAGRQSIEKRTFRMQEIPASFLYEKPGKPGREVFAMSQIKVSHVTFSYEGSFDEIFTDVSFVLDTDWKLGFIGRNGKGKTTFLRLLLGELPYQGTILSS